jgi:tetratricopeptide (TPR) repeat protein
MLKKADRIRSEDGYITDSLGWALFKLKKYSKAKTYLQKAIQIMPADPVINDHFADSLWMNGNKLQARYYWNYVLNLEDTDKELREKISDKIVFGLKN